MEDYMLKIKDNIDLNTLKRYGFHKEDCYYLIDNENIYIYIKDRYIDTFGESDLNTDFVLLFDMIQDGIVEKLKL